MTPPKDQSSADRAYCRTLLAREDEDLFLSLGYAPAADRRLIAALFAFVVEIRRIPPLVSEPALGEIRLQWWREALDEIRGGSTPRAHPVVGELAASAAPTSAAHATMERLIDARARLLYAPHFSTLDDLAAFLAEAEAPLAALAAGEESDALAAAGSAYALARFAPALAPALAEAAAAESRRLYEGARPALDALSAALQGRAAFLALTPAYSARPDGRAFPLVRRLTLFRAILTGRF